MLKHVPAVTRTAVIAGLVLGTAAGCGGGGRTGARSQGSTVAPTTSNKPAPVTSGTTSPVPTSTTTTPPAPPVATTPPVNPANQEVVVASMLMNDITVLNAATGAVKANVAVGKGPMAVAVNGTYAYVAGSLDQKVTVVDLLTNTVSHTMDATGPGVSNLPLIGSTIDPILKPLVRPTGIAVTPNGTKAFTANLINVTSYDLNGKKPLKSIFGLNLNIQPGGTGITGLITTVLSTVQGIQSFLQQPLAALGQARVATTNKTAFVTNMITNNVTVISASDDKVIRYTDVGKLPIGVACAANKAYVACAISNEVYVLDETTGLVRTKFAAGQVPVDCAASPTGDKVYIANFLGGDVTVVDTASDLPVNILPAGISILGIFQQLGVPIPTSSSTGISGAISSFLSGFLGGAGVNTGIGGLLGGTSPIGLNNVLNGLLSAFLSFAGINQQSLSSLNLPGIGIMSVSVTKDGSRVCVANLLFGLGVTEVSTKKVSSPQVLSGQGLGVTAVGCGK